MKPNTNFTTSEIFNAENSTKEDYIYEDNPSPLKNRAFSFKYTIVFVVIVALIAGASFLFNKKTEEQLSSALYQESSVVIDRWMDRFQDIGNNTIKINHDNAVNPEATRSIALSELKDELEKVYVQTPKGIVYLKNVNVVLKKGKTYEIIDAATGKSLKL